MQGIRKATAAALLLVALQGCSSHRFVPTGDFPVQASRGSQCGATVLRSMPSAPHRELGLCYASVPGGGLIADNTPDAIEELKKCTCEAGGNAAVLDNSTEQGFVTSFGGSQQTLKITGIVIVR